MNNSAFMAWLRRNLTWILALLAFATAAFTYISITDSSAPLGLKPRRVVNLLFVNIAILSLLVGIVAMRIYTLWNALRVDKAGSKLQKRILILFSLVTIIPTLVVSVFSALFFNFGIQTWFNERLQTVVTESLAVAEAYLDEHRDNIRGDAIAMAHDLSREVASRSFFDPQEFAQAVATQAVVRELTEAAVFKDGNLIAQGRYSFALAFENISQQAMEKADRGEVVMLADADEDKVRALVKLEAPPRSYLLVGRLIDGKVIGHMQSTQGAVSEYETLKGQLGKLQYSFLGVFITLALLLLVAAVWYGMVFAARLTTPLASLLQAAERVRGGDFSARVENGRSKDEVGKLGRAFNRMTEQLEAQRGELIEANRRLDERRRFSEAVLSGVSAGVIALDRAKSITLFNRSSAAILETVGQPLAEGMHINELLPGISEMLAQAEHHEVADSTLTLSKEGKSITLHVRVTIEELGDEIAGFIVTFDDITLLVSAQRNAAWADVARRVAHEIKNPLTPIQLAAERLKRKYSKVVGSEEEETFSRYTDTIAKNVADIGKMVEEFVSFARMPAAVMRVENLVDIIKKTVFTSQVACPTIEYQLLLPEAPLMLECDERQITQVLNNVLKNAAESIEAKEAASGAAIQGKIVVEGAAVDGGITITITDNGTGIEGGDSKKVFEPYVTGRAKGTGLGLSIVKKIMEDHKGLINISNELSGDNICGAKVTLSFSKNCDI